MIYLTGIPEQVVSELAKYGVGVDLNDTDFMLDLLANETWPPSYQMKLTAVHGDAIGTYGYMQSWSLSIENPLTGHSIGAVSGHSIGEVAARLILKKHERGVW